MSVALYCFTCKKIKRINYIHSKNGLISSIYGGQRASSKKRGHSLPTYSKQELKQWLFSQKKFHTLYDNWKRLDFQKDYIPSVDRSDDSIGYTMANIQLVTWKKNREKQYRKARSGEYKIVVNPQATVRQFTKDGVFVAEYVSIREASRCTKTACSYISSCCSGKHKSAKGYIWKKNTGALFDSDI